MPTAPGNRRPWISTRRRSGVHELRDATQRQTALPFFPARSDDVPRPRVGQLTVAALDVTIHAQIVLSVSFGRACWFRASRFSAINRISDDPSGRPRLPFRSGGIGNEKYFGLRLSLGRTFDEPRTRSNQPDRP